MVEHHNEFEHDVVVVGGAGHVGLPLAIAFASRGLDVSIYDINQASVDGVNRGELPFMENGAQDLLTRVLAEGRLSATTDSSVLGRAEHVVVVIGTPVDEHLNPDPTPSPARSRPDATSFRAGQLVVLRSTVYPGVTRRVEKLFADNGTQVDVAFCPERIAEGKAMEELFDLPQIVSARTPAVRERAAALFRHLTDSIVELEPEEAELAKLFTNTWRYIKFAAANQFYVMANDHGLDYDVIRKALAFDYPRAADMPGRGLRGRVRACSRTRCSWRRSPTTRSSSATRRCSSTRVCRSTSSPGSRRSTASRTSPSASSAWRSRARATTSARACPTS